MSRLPARPGALAMLAAVALSTPTLVGCGAGDKDEVAAGPDDAFVVRVARQQQVGLALSKTGVRRVSTRALAREMVRLRERTLGLLAGPLGRAAGGGAEADLGVTPQQGAEDLTPDTLRGARPFERAFLLVMLRHQEGTLALAGAQLRRGKDPEVRAIAQRMAVDTTREMSRVRSRLTRLAGALSR